MQMSSSSDVTTRSEKELLLQALANLPEKDLGIGDLSKPTGSKSPRDFQLEKKFGELLNRDSEVSKTLFAFVPENADYFEVLHRFGYYLRSAWLAKPRSRDWFMLRAREVEARYRAAAAHRAAATLPPQVFDWAGFLGSFGSADVRDLARIYDAIEKSLDVLPELTPLEAAFVHLQEIQQRHRTRKCKNEDCPAPYFIIRKSSRQGYCDTDCADISRRDKGNTWWKENRGKGSDYWKAKQRERKTQCKKEQC